MAIPPWSIGFLWFEITLATLHYVDSREINLLNGQHLRIASLNVIPYMHLSLDNKNITYRADGIVYDIILWLSIRYNFTFTLTVPIDATFGSLVNESWNGMIGMALNQQVELIAAPTVPSFDRVQVLDFTTTFSEEPMCSLIPAPEIDGNKISAIIKPFDFQVWILLILCMLSVAIGTWLTSYLYHLLQRALSSPSGRRKSGPIQLSVIEHLFVTFRVICQQPKDLSTRSTTSSEIIVKSAWSLACIVVVYVYTGSLTSYMTIPRLKPVVNSLEELACSTRLKVAAIQSSIFQSILLQSTSGPMQLLGNQLRQNPENSLSGNYYNLSKLLEKAERGQHAIILSKSQAETIIGLDWKRGNRCHLALMSEQILSMRFCFALPKRSSYTNLIDRGMIMMNDAGLLQNWKKRSRVVVAQYCEAANQKKTKLAGAKKSLSLENMSGAFVLLAVGISISFITFIIEIVCLLFKKLN